MSKNIIFCADGTWNTVNPSVEVTPQGSTNVYKLFTLLQGGVIPSTVKKEGGDVVEIEKAKTTGDILQVAKYINGVGNSKSKIQRLFGGGFGAGLVKRIVRGFTYISRNYEPSDKIYIIGFSRGAYTARALAGMIASQGLLNQEFIRGSSDAYKLGTQAWYRYRKSVKGKADNWLPDFMTAVLNSDVGDFLSNDFKPGDFIEVDNIKTVAVWDTVGAMGIPNFELEEGEVKIKDTFAFVDNILSSKVNAGFHAVALDEQRLLFTPTLWDPREGVKQMVFPGGHSDVGGGYIEKGLSDAALEWFIQELFMQGVQFGNWRSQVSPDCSVPAHQEWRNLTGLTKNVRKFHPDSNILEHTSIQKRKGQGNVVHHRDENEPKSYDLKPYVPTNWPPV